MQICWVLDFYANVLLDWKKLKMKTNIAIPFVESQSNWLNWSVFVGETFADPTIKKSKYFLSNLKYQLKNKYPPLAKNIAKGYHSVVTHVLYHFCDMSLMTACVIFCKLTSFTLSAHVLSWETPFASWQIRKWPRWLWVSDWWFIHIILTYNCWHCFLVFNIWVSYALEMTMHFYYPTLELFCFSFTQPFADSKFCLPNPFLFGANQPPPLPPPAINNERPLAGFQLIHLATNYWFDSFSRMHQFYDFNFAF
jgi:hypothetical protein